MPISLGAHHPRLTAARTLLTKKGRDATGRFLIEGPTLLAEALAAGVEIEAVFIRESAVGDAPVLQISPERIAVVPDAAHAKLSAVEQPTGLVAIAVQRPDDLAAVLRHDHLLVLAGLADPGNVGTLLRSALAFGVGGVVLLAGGVERYNPKIVRAAMGALFRLDCATLSGQNAGAALAGRPLIAAGMDGEALDGFVFPARSAIVIGHERRGIPRSELPISATVGIPQAAASESLNAGVAGSIILYALSKQMRLSRLG